MFGEAFDECFGSASGGFVDVGGDLDACFFELVEAAAGYLRIGIDGGADDVFDSGVDDGLRAGGSSEVTLVGFEGAVDCSAFGGVACDSDCDGFGVGSGIGLGSALLRRWYCRQPRR